MKRHQRPVRFGLSCVLVAVPVAAVLFFALGVVARVIKSDLRVPPDMAKILSIYLLMAIGLHGGYELGKADLGTAFTAVLWALALGFVLPLVGYLLLIAT